MEHPEELETLRARNADMREQLESTLSTVAQQAVQLEELQTAVAAVTGQSTSSDGLVSVRVDAAGAATEIALAPTAFDRSTPAKLGRSIVQALQQAATQAGQARTRILAPLQAELSGLPGLETLPRHVPAPSAAPPRDTDDYDFAGGVW